MSEPTDAAADSVPGPRTTPVTLPSSAPSGLTEAGPDVAVSESEPGTAPKTAAPEPQMRYVDLTGSREAAGRSIRMRDMARRLPQLVRRSLALAWQVDQRATIGLLLCQAVAGVMQALGLESRKRLADGLPTNFKASR